MSIAARRRVGVVGLLGLLAGALVLMLAPGNPGALRLAGVGLFWWYAVLAAPLAAVLLVAVVQRLAPSAESIPGGSAALAVAAWTSPVVLALVGARIFSGAADGPAIALVVLVAPLIALLDPVAGRGARSNLVAALAISAGVGSILWANLLLLVDVWGLVGLPRWVASIMAAALALLSAALPRRGGAVGATPRTRAPSGPGLTLLYHGGALGFLVSVAVIASTLAVSPWGAWRDVASRPALTFGARNTWVTEGRTLAAPTVLEFTEAHRVTALSPATYRVVEPGRFREWQLRAGESLALRAGDRLVLDAGARLRFEAGKRVPGAPASGVAWADPPERGASSTAAAVLAVAVTLIGGALALAGPGRGLSGRGVYTGSGLVLALVLGALHLGVYGAYEAPGLSIGAPALAAVFELPTAVVPGAAGRALVVLSATALLALFSATALALRDVLGRAMGAARRGDAGGTAPRHELAGPAMTTFLVAASVASLWPADATRVLLAGLGLAASAAVAPRLAGHGAGSRLVGSLVGALAFVGLAALDRHLPAWAGVVGTYPVLAAAPLAWLAARAGGRLPRPRDADTIDRHGQ
ncbi:MAG: hypothetical protein DMD96_21720 [Candidatus Rokuibacteriota bacterium]|nr:MAG: hypothetical protein DMD96_21720 [Candidatus Rokubacteria bacterium]